MKKKKENNKKKIKVIKKSKNLAKKENFRADCMTHYKQ